MSRQPNGSGEVDATCTAFLRTARCQDCQVIWESGSNILRKVAAHVRLSGHSVDVETHERATYLPRASRTA